jgi:hypothetical protein
VIFLLPISRGYHFLSVLIKGLMFPYSFMRWTTAEFRYHESRLFLFFYSECFRRKEFKDDQWKNQDSVMSWKLDKN